MNARKVAQGLGWFSLGLGLYEVAAPGDLSRRLGLDGREGLLRLYGAREVTAGLGIFLTPANPAPWVWARVAGDALDIATLTAALLRPGSDRRIPARVALASVVGITVLDVLCAHQLNAPSGDTPHAA